MGTVTQIATCYLLRLWFTQAHLNWIRWVLISGETFRWVTMWCEKHERTILAVQDLMVVGIFSWHSLGPFVPTAASFNYHSLPQFYYWPCPSLYDPCYSPSRASSWNFPCVGVVFSLRLLLFCSSHPSVSFSLRPLATTHLLFINPFGTWTQSAITSLLYRLYRLGKNCVMQVVFPYGSTLSF